MAKPRVVSDDYDQGRKDQLVEIITDALAELGYKNPPSVSRFSLMAIEREGAIKSLRKVCRIAGDNDWPNELILEDIINNHLLNHLKRRRHR